jgi:hypothetical protein
MDFSEARDLFGIIFQIPRPKYKIMDYGLISKKPRGFFAKMLGNIEFQFFRFISQWKNPWTQSTLRGPQLRAGPRWTHMAEQTGKPLESGRDDALTCRCSPTAARKGKGGMGDSPRGSPELGERWSGRATRVNWWRRRSSVGVCSDVGEEERGMVSGAGCSGAEVPLL